jgi:hypothetical protein
VKDCLRTGKDAGKPIDDVVEMVTEALAGHYTEHSAIMDLLKTGA